MARPRLYQQDQEPWVKEGMSKASWYRARETKPSETKPARETKPSVHRRRSPAKSGVRGADAMRAVEIARKAGDARALRTILAEAFPNEDEDATLKAYTRANNVARTHDHRILLIRQWAGPQWDSKPEAARDFLDDFIKVAGPNRAKRLGELFDHLARQWASPGQKFIWLKKYRDRMKDDPLYWPQMRPMRTTSSDILAERVIALMDRNLTRHWTVRELARRFQVTIYKMDGLTMEMRIRRWIVLADEGQGLLTVPRPGLQIKKTVPRRIIDNLIASGDGIGFAAMRAIIGQNIGAQVNKLRKIGILDPGSPLKLSQDTRERINRNHVIRNRRRILWAPEGLMF